ncbi:MAG: hypothetical protein AB7N70_27760 [Dehalococcoidia bacterium]
MPELLEFQEVIGSHPGVVGAIAVAVALVAAIVTRWVDQSSLNAANDRLSAYEQEIRMSNEARADLLARLEERGDELRRARAELARREGLGNAPPVEPAGDVRHRG